MLTPHCACADITTLGTSWRLGHYKGRYIVNLILCMLESHLGLGLAAAPSIAPPLPHREQAA